MCIKKKRKKYCWTITHCSDRFLDADGQRLESGCPGAEGVENYTFFGSESTLSEASMKLN